MRPGLRAHRRIRRHGRQPEGSPVLYAQRVTPEAVLPTSRKLLLVNRASAPRLGRAPIWLDRSAAGADEAYASGAVYPHVHVTTSPEPPANCSNEDGLWVAARSDNVDTYVSPGGREGALRLGMRPGRRYSISVDLLVPERQRGQHNAAPRSIHLGTLVNGVTSWVVARSYIAPNEPGRYRLDLTATIPADATGAWIRLMSGTGQLASPVAWDRLQVTRTRLPVPYFDGDTPADRWYTYRWRGEPNTSYSVRTMVSPARSLAGAAPSEVVSVVLTQVATRATQGLNSEIAEFSDYLTELVGSAGRSLVAASKAAALGRTALALEHAERAVAMAPNLPQGWDLFSDLLFRSGNFAKSKDAASKAAELSESPSSYYRVGRALEKVNDFTQARTIILKATKSDTLRHAPLQDLARQDTKALLPRIEVHDFLERNLTEIRDRADSFRDTFPAHHWERGVIPIFCYWGQGFESAPPVVQRCKTELIRTSKPVTFLDNSNIPYFAELPEQIQRLMETHRAHYSDLLRLDLLARYGGIWIDATCLVTTDIRVPLGCALGTSPFFAFRYGGSRISSWLMAARPDSRIPVMLRSAMLLWWEKEDRLNDYFLIHHIFEFLTVMDEACRQEWLAAPVSDARLPHKVQNAMFSSNTAEESRELLSASFVHKLRYQYRDYQISIDSLLASIVRGDPLLPLSQQIRDQPSA